MDYLADLWKHKWVLIGIGLLFFGIGYIVRSLDRESGVAVAPAEEPPLHLLLASPTQQSEHSTSSVEQEDEARVIVHVTGAVRAPDVYNLPADARIKDLVLAAGGLSPDADPERINLAERLADGQKIHIPRQGEAASQSSAELSKGDTAQSGRINLNTASAEQLEQLSGIGQALAKRIVEYRDQHGPFRSIEDLQEVRGIGAQLFSEIAAQLTVEP